MIPCQELEVNEAGERTSSTNERCTDGGEPSIRMTRDYQYALIVYRRYQSFPHVTEETLGYI
jgi:hypothetical protein